VTDKSKLKTLKAQGVSSELNFSYRVDIPDGVMMQEVDGEAVIVNLDSESYFGLDDVGTHMWTLLTNSTSIEAAFDALIDEYDVDEAQLRTDFVKLLHKLVEHGLLILKDAEAV